MAISREIEYESLAAFRLDPQNPRLGHRTAEESPTQKQVLDEMEDWKLDELAVSFLASGGFWAQEALLAIRERVGNRTVLTVVEGNRRLAALQRLQAINNGDVPKSSRWRQVAALAEERPPSADLFARIPYLLVDQRSDVDEYLGFRHVTGIEEWHPAEKAAYIARLIDERGMSYEEVMRKIGSKTPTVRQHYIAHRLLCQMRDDNVLPEDGIQNRFSVMYLSLRTPGVKTIENVKKASEHIRLALSQAHQMRDDAKLRRAIAELRDAADMVAASGHPEPRSRNGADRLSA